MLCSGKTLAQHAQGSEFEPHQWKKKLNNFNFYFYFVI
jgi:hypothetical protein